VQYIEAVSNEIPAHSVELFLAGGITNCPDWQSEIIKIPGLKELDITVWNPRRADFPIDDPDAADEQIRWEFEKLNRSHIISFWFCKETLCPIVLYELGRHLVRSCVDDTVEVVIGVEPGYERHLDVCIQSRLVDPDVFHCSDLAGLVFGIRQAYRELTGLPA